MHEPLEMGESALGLTGAVDAGAIGSLTLPLLRPSMAWIVLLIAYAAATASAWMAAQHFADAGSLWQAAAGDVVATVVVFAVGSRVRNASLYDPYWSVAPIVIAAYWLMHPELASGLDARQWLVLGAVSIWGVRLTYNWGSGWHGLEHEDWRYRKLREDTGVFYPFVNLMGIHMFPTVLVFLGMLPAWVAMGDGAPLSIWDGIGFTVCVIATVIEAVADLQLRAFKRDNDDPQAFIRSGLWRYSRHPNYFGEQLLWWGLFLFTVPHVGDTWWTCLGAVAMGLLFTFISIPMMEKRMVAKRPHYADHQRTTSACVPWFPRAESGA